MRERLVEFASRLALGGDRRQRNGPLLAVDLDPDRRLRWRCRSVEETSERTVVLDRPCGEQERSVLVLGPAQRRRTIGERSDQFALNGEKSSAEEIVERAVEHRLDVEAITDDPKRHR